MQTAGCLHIDPRHAKELHLALGSAVAAAVLFAVCGALALAFRQFPGAIVLLALLYPLCGFTGVRTRSSNCIATFCCCTGGLGLLFVIGCIALLAFAKPVLVCVCDTSCAALPSFGGPRGGGGGGPSLSDLRNSTLYVDNLCPNQASVISSFSAYAVIGTLAMVAQILACALLCRVRGRWLDDARVEGGMAPPPRAVAASAWPQQQQISSASDEIASLAVNPHAKGSVPTPSAPPSYTVAAAAPRTKPLVV